MNGDDDVTRADKLFADVIDLCDQLRAASRPHSEKERLFGVAITEAQTAQMWVVKAITFVDVP